jgi:hypothetical protein
MTFPKPHPDQELKADLTSLIRFYGFKMGVLQIYKPKQIFPSELLVEKGRHNFYSCAHD